MRSFYVNVLIEFSDEEHKDWSEGADETFGIARKLDAQTNGVHILDYHEVENNQVYKYGVLTEEGGV